MTLDHVPGGTRVFVDPNILVYHFQPHPGFGPACHRLLERIERQDIEGYTATNLLGELAHRLMVIEASALSALFLLLFLLFLPSSFSFFPCDNELSSRETTINHVSKPNHRHK